MNPDPTTPGGGASGSPSQSPRELPPPQGKGPQPGPRAPRGRYTAGQLVVLCLITALAGAFFLGGARALTGVATGRTAEEPVDPAGQDAQPSAGEVVAQLRGDHDGLREGVDLSGEVCGGQERDSPFGCASAMETNLVRVLAYDDPALSLAVVAGLRGQVGEDDNDMVDVRQACHTVLIWFEGAGMDEGERGAMADDVEDVVGC